MINNIKMLADEYNNFDDTKDVNAKRKLLQSIANSIIYNLDDDSFDYIP